MITKSEEEIHHGGGNWSKIVGLFDQTRKSEPNFTEFEENLDHSSD
jgi:hypothetical protein